MYKGIFGIFTYEAKSQPDEDELHAQGSANGHRNQIRVDGHGRDTSEWAEDMFRLQRERYVLRT